MRLLISFVIVITAGIIIKSEEQKDLAALRNKATATWKKNWPLNSNHQPVNYVATAKMNNEKESFDWIFFGKYTPLRILDAVCDYNDATRVKSKGPDDFPGNGWALMGPSDTLGRLEKSGVEVRKRFTRAWFRAGIALPSSRIY